MTRHAARDRPRRAQCTHSREGWGEERKDTPPHSRGPPPPFLRLLSRAGEKGEEGGEEGRRDRDPRKRAGAGGVRACARRGERPGRPAGSRSRPAPRLPAGVAPNTRTTGTFLTGTWVRGDWQMSSPCSGLAM